MNLPEEPENLYVYEQLARADGYQKVIGIDEAGRGPLAGPVVIAAVHLPPHKNFDQLNDSKQLTEKQRDALYTPLTEDPEIEWSVAVMDVDVISQRNILQATIDGMKQCAEAIPDADLIFVDGNPVSSLPRPSINVVKGDAKCACIAAASIIAKVQRDRIMKDYDDRYPGYGFADHKGYGTSQHLAALRRLGPSPIHRETFAPVAAIIQDQKQGKLDFGM